MNIKEAFPVPAIYINNYIWASLQTIDPTLAAKYDHMPFYPLADAVAGNQGWDGQPYVVYDQLMKFRAQACYSAHKSQTYYWIRGEADDVLGWTTAITHILDREDAAAQDINSWVQHNDPTAGIFFHSVKTFQIDTAQEERMDLSVRQYYTGAMIIEHKYHITRDNGFN